jgi:hypothetical protein
MQRRSESLGLVHLRAPGGLDHTKRVELLRLPGHIRRCQRTYIPARIMGKPHRRGSNCMARTPTRLTQTVRGRGHHPVGAGKVARLHTSHRRVSARHTALTEKNHCEGSQPAKRRRVQLPHLDRGNWDIGFSPSHEDVRCNFGRDVRCSPARRRSRRAPRGSAPCRLRGQPCLRSSLRPTLLWLRVGTKVADLSEVAGP